ncbi:MAG: (2Fe-2S)-binding protein [Deltaproteobacteria bacterium]|nr:(2Fe-2S)-binding protein [Deltaproteobacteria bacterium]MBI3296031.1 (2Fe-2S)-binding protein [Deltaproteobacteria bacterium]
MKTVTLTINGQAVTVNEGTTVFQAAQAAGVFVPHYCYHPDLSIAGVCRMCMVEIEKVPRPQISCNTVATEGMVVRTDTPKIKDTVKGVLELHLINHPLDCPICDKAGECKLQDFYQSYGLYTSRMEHEKVHKPKVQDIGTIVLDSERCILCTRCVRFTDEVTHSNELGIFNRGDRSELRTYDEGPLKNDYTGNLADICPVGALTAKDFRFQQRVWFLDKTKSVCTMCAHGCNTAVSINSSTKKLYRVEPRRNPEVNQSWICDTGRWGIHSLTENRVATPLKNAGGFLDATWNQAFSEMKRAITEAPEKTLVFLSTAMTNEEVVDVCQVMFALGVKNFSWLVDEAVVSETQPFDGILKHHDLSANARGTAEILKRLGLTNLGMKAGIDKVKTQPLSQVVAVGLDAAQGPLWVEVAAVIPTTTQSFVHATNHHPSFEAAKWVLPNTTSFEKTGTIVSALARVQKVNRILPAQGLARDSHALAWGISRGDDRSVPSKERAKTIFESSIQSWFCPGEKFSQFNEMGVAL